MSDEALNAEKPENPTKDKVRTTGAGTIRTRST